MRTLSLTDARLVILGRQLFPARARTPVEVVEGAGFVRTLGGVDAYLALRARATGLTRAAVDAALATRALQVVPAVRGCIYLVARRDAGLCLRVADSLTAARTAREHAKAGVRPGELDALGRAVVAALAAGPLATDGLRRALPAGAVRSLGELGKKIGVTSTLPPSLRVLEHAGAIERTLEGDRLDAERYRWRLAARSVVDDVRIPDSQEGRLAALAERFFAAAGLSTLAAFADWCGIAQRDARAAVAGLALEPIAIEGRPGAWLLAPGAAPAAAARDAVALFAFEDNLTALPGGPGLFVDDAHHDVPVPVWGGVERDLRLGEARYLSLRPIVAEGRFAGFWEYHPDRRAIVTATLGAVAARTAAQIGALAADTARFLRDEVGHAHSYSLDTDDELRRRCAAIERLGGKAPAAAAKPPAAPARSSKTRAGMETKSTTTTTPKPATKLAETKSAATKKLGATKPAAKKLGATKPSTKKLGATKPAAKKLGATKPAAKKLGATKPAAKKLGATKSAATKSAATKSAANPARSSR